MNRPATASSATASSAGPVLLDCAGRTVAHYGYGAAADNRPRLHPVTTLAGRTVTQERPADHLHHLGVSIAVPDVSGRNFWGGRTYVRGQGPTALDNHGVQRSLGLERHGPGGFAQSLAWEADGVELLREHRTVNALELSATAWALDLSFALTNRSADDLSVGSPATNGRPGAGYGGFFWRAPKEAAPPDVFTSDRAGEEAVHGRAADWLALAGDGWTLVFAGADEETRRDPWFVRTAEYPGVGSSLAADERLPVPAGATVVRRVVTVVADGRLDREAAAGYVRQAVTS
ncbi:PmoA family protein [Streptomyces sp. ATCC51928]|uniref:PmoA family protein n=1 Tax=Streptomyces caviscabies TaxID=90079 RepID=A0ABW2MJ78_9ACTN|nr:MULTISPECIES: PmoA family protein [unclassified Streptomyces]MDX3503385.1 PmoA family protein [Streptomyces sp. ATCC51928]MDX5523744.1 PmoA family protein [Streptomyces sp. DE06-01C]